MPVNHLGKTSDEIRRFGRSLITTYGASEATFEALSYNIIRDIYGEFTDEKDQPLFALLRTFRLCQHNDLPADIFHRVDPATARYWLALVATVGQQAAWNDRHQSQNHQAIPAGAFSSPMLKAAFEQINLDPDKPIDPVVTTSLDMVMLQEPISFTRYFYVEQALGNPNIVDQETFVKPYAIQSVLGMGAPFVSGAFYLTLFFSKVHLSLNDVQLLMQLSPYISTLLAIYDEKGRYWD